MTAVPGILHKRGERQPNLLDLNEYIFREIFQYLDNEMVYFTLRNVSRKLKHYVDAYVQLGAIFAVVAGRCNCDLRQSILLYILTKNDKVTSIAAKVFDKIDIMIPIVHDSLGPYSPYLGSFGAKFNGKIVTGVHSSKTLQCSLPFYINEYNAKENKWIPIHSLDYGTYDTLVRSPIQYWCQIGDSKLLMFHNNYNNIHLRLVHVNISGEEKYKKFWRILKKSGKPRSTYSSSMVEFPFQLRGITQFSVIRVAQNKIMLVGGIYQQTSSDSRINEKYNQILWQCTLTNDQNDVTWMTLDSELIKVRLKPMCFKLKDNLYIAGGEDEPKASSIFSRNGLLCCDRYNMKENKYYKTLYTLPYPLSDVETSIATNDKETFALILDFTNTKILLFSEDEGFKEFHNFAPRAIKRKIMYKILLNIR